MMFLEATITFYYWTLNCLEPFAWEQILNCHVVICEVGEAVKVCMQWTDIGVSISTCDHPRLESLVTSGVVSCAQTEMRCIKDKLCSKSAV